MYLIPWFYNQQLSLIAMAITADRAYSSTDSKETGRLQLRGSAHLSDRESGRSDRAQILDMSTSDKNTIWL